MEQQRGGVKKEFLFILTIFIPSLNIDKPTYLTSKDSIQQQPASYTHSTHIWRKKKYKMCGAVEHHENQKLRYMMLKMRQTP